ncbi:MAG: CHASE2 domain-containing protein [Patescibacteria group bacterium]
MNINYFTNNYKVVSFIDVLENLVDSNVFKDKIVLV